MNFFFSHIQNKLITGFIMVLLIPLLAVGIYSYQTTNKVLTQAQIESETNLAKSKANSVNFFLERVLYSVLHLSHHQNIVRLAAARQSGNQEAINNAIEDVLNTFMQEAQKEGYYHQLQYISERGIEIARIQSDGSKMHIVPREDLENSVSRYYFKETMKLNASQIYVSNLDLNVIHGEIEEPHTPVIRYATPLYYRNGEKAGIVIVNVLANYFLGALASVPNENCVRYLVNNADGSFLVHPDETKTWGNDLKTGVTLKTEFPQIADLSEKISRQGSAQSGDDLIFFHEIIPPGQIENSWKMISIYPIKQILRPVRNFTIVFVLLLIIALIGAVVLAVLIARGISRPIMHLTQVAEQISQGDLDTEIKITSKDEIGKLAESFSRMHSSMQAAIIRLRKKPN